MPAETTAQLAATLAHTFTAEQLHQLHEDAVTEIDTVVDTDAWGILVDALFIARTPGDAHPAVEQIRQLRAKVAEQEALLTQAYDHNVDVQDDREQLTAQRDRFKAELAAVRDAAWRQKQALDAERTQWLAEIASLVALIALYDDEAVISIGLIRKALREGPAPVPGSSQRAQEPALSDVQLYGAKLHDKVHGWNCGCAPWSHVKFNEYAAILLAALGADGRLVAGSHSSDPAPAAPKLATGGIIRRNHGPVIAGELRERLEELPVEPAIADEADEVTP